MGEGERSPRGEKSKGGGGQGDAKWFLKNITKTPIVVFSVTAMQFHVKSAGGGQGRRQGREWGSSPPTFQREFPDCF